VTVITLLRRGFSLPQVAVLLPFLNLICQKIDQTELSMVALITAMYDGRKVTELVQMHQTVGY
jgi:hypothetical protein